MADKNRVPRPLGWCSSCLASDQRERPAVTSHHGTSLCRACNAAAQGDPQAFQRLGELAAQAQAQAEAALEEGRKVLAQALHLGRPR